MGKRKQLNLFESFAKRPCHRSFSDDSNRSTVSTSTNSIDTGSDADNSCDKNDNSLPICDSVNDVTSTASSSSSNSKLVPEGGGGTPNRFDAKFFKKSPKLA